MQELLEAERRYAAIADVTADDIRDDEARRLLGPAAGRIFAARARTTCGRAAGRSASTRRTRWWTRAPASSRPRRRICTAPTTRRAKRLEDRATVGRDSRQRPEPDRAGRRVRLLLRARRDGASRAGLRDDHDQLESRDRLDRLRHLRQAVLRAADPRGRARDRPPRGAGRRDRAARRTDAAQADASARGGWRQDPRHLA